MILERWRGGATIRLGLPPGDLHVLEDVLEDDLREQDLIAAGDLAGHAALHLHHALAVREVQAPQYLKRKSLEPPWRRTPASILRTIL